MVVEVSKNEEEILLRYKTSQTKIPAGSRETGQVSRFDNIVLECFSRVGNKNLPVSEPMVQAKPKALEIVIR